MKKVNKVIIYIIIFFAIFDTTRNYTYLPKMFGYLKEGALFYLNLIIFLEKKRIPKLNWSYFLFILTILITSLYGFKEPILYVEKMIFFYKYLQLFLLINIFFNLESTFKLKYNKIVNLYLKFCYLLIFINIVGYFIENPIISRYINSTGRPNYNWRISVGQPGIVAYPILSAITYSIFYKIKTNKDLFLLIYLTIGFLILIPGTGIPILLLNLTIRYCFYYKEDMYKRYLKIMFFIIIISWYIIFVKYSEEFSKHIGLFMQKINTILYRIKDPSLEERRLKWEVIKNRKNLFSLFFGNGIFGYYLNSSEYTNLENTYRIIYMTYGFLGLVFFIIFLKIEFIKKLKNKDYFKVCTLINFVIYSLTLDTLYTFMIVSSFTFMYSLRRKVRKKLKNNKLGIK